MRKVLSIHLYPGIDLKEYLENHFGKNLRRKNIYYAVLIRSFGSGNGPDCKEYFEYLQKNHIPVFNVTECTRGATTPSYEASLQVEISS